MPNELRRLEAHFKDEIEKLKAKNCRQKILLKEQTCGFGSTWPWFDSMRCIMGGFSKGDKLEGGTDQGCSPWEESSMSTRWMPGTQDEHVPSTHVVDVIEDTCDVDDHDHMTPPSVVGDSAIEIASGEWPLPACDSPCTASCKKLGVSWKPNARK